MPELLKLALPTIAMRSGALIMVMVDVIMLGHHASDELAVYSLSQGPVSTLMLAALGLQMGVMIVTAQLFGAGCDARCGGVWRRGLPYALLTGGVVAVICAAGPQPFRWLGQEEHLAVGAAEVTRILGLGLPGYLGYLASGYFLEGLKRPWPATWLMLAANALNAALNAWWIGGGWGVEAMGAAGAAWATTVARWFLCIAAAAWVWNLSDHVRFRIREPAARDPAGAAQQRRLGYAAGLSIGFEAFGFSALNVMSGWFGAEALAAYAIGINILGTVFMVALGVGAATSVRVGHAVGRGDPADAEVAGWTGLGLDVLLVAPVSLAFAAAPLAFAGFYTDDPAVRAAAAALVLWMAAILPFDGAQAVMSNALRGWGETWAPSLLQGSAYLLVMMPAGWWLGSRMGFGVSGLFAAILGGSIVSSVLLCMRFRYLSRRGRNEILRESVPTPL
ncbi:Multidrug resistance protein [uncultured Alphaproteobacteria bacterium]|uniref:Multidrug resistance protein n=1 Tax=uncultured Alphaproteobacteria bacterium TaxID=91750 RepID=A0A212KKW2_9PROT|nr:Multidrug resistance protein [uncultured Alphaproteobacteria bacterium]